MPEESHGHVTVDEVNWSEADPSDTSVRWALLIDAGSTGSRR